MKKIMNIEKFSSSDKKLIQEWQSFSDDWDAGWLIINGRHVNIFRTEWLCKKDRKLFTIVELFDGDEDDYKLWKEDLPILKCEIIKQYLKEKPKSYVPSTVKEGNISYYCLDEIKIECKDYMELKYLE